MRMHKPVVCIIVTVLCLVALVGSMCGCSGKTARYSGRTTLLVWPSASSSKKCPTPADIVKEAESAKVVRSAASTMTALGIADPKILKGLHVEHLAGTRIIQIEVIGEDPEEAKVAADVVAAEVKRLHPPASGASVVKVKLSGKTPDNSRIATVDPVGVTPVKGKRYRAVTTLMERRSSTPRSGALSVTDLEHIALCQTVMTKTANSLAVLRSTINPITVLQEAELEPVAGTKIIAIKVTTDDPAEAKAAAEAWSDSFKEYYQDLKASGEDIITLDPAFVTPLKRGLF